jgi:hypothetical protein
MANPPFSYKREWRTEDVAYFALLCPDEIGYIYAISMSHIAILREL